MKPKILNLLLIITSLIGYLEWGQGNSTFLFQAETDVIIGLFTDPGSMIHPFILLPLLGQLILVFTLFQSRPGKVLTFVSMGSLGVLLGFMFVIGVMGMNVKIAGSTVPFLAVAIMTVRYYRKTSGD